MYYNNGYMPQNGYYQPMNSGAMPDNLSMLRQQSGQYQQQFPQYQQGTQQGMQMPTQQPQPNNSGMIWVQGEEGAKAYLVANGNTVVLWDSENQCIYIKSADQSGIPSMRILDWTERSTAPKMPLQGTESKQVDFITRDEFNALEAKIDGYINEKATPKTKKTTTEG